jgi:hypothetical protein
MKTTSNVQKTVNRKFEKPVSKTFAVVLSLVLISFTVSANGFWKHLLVHNTFGKMAILMVDQDRENDELMARTSGTTTKHATKALNCSTVFVPEPVKEENLEIESWMTDQAFFGTTVTTDQISNEKPLEIENWMICSPYFERAGISNECEPSLKLESWMKDENRWVN